MGRAHQFIGPVALFFAVPMLLVLPPSSACADYEASSFPAAESGSKPVALKSLTQKMEVANGECGIMFPERAMNRRIGKEDRRKLCFALQSYGFLTRYMQSVETAASAWGQDVCLLLSFCGDGCHRLYGHPQHKPAHLLSFFGGGQPSSASPLEQQQIADQKGLLSERGGIVGWEAMAAKNGDQSKPLREKHHSGTLEKSSSEGPHVTKVTTDDRCQANGPLSSDKECPAKRCSHHFMSRAFPESSRRRISRSIYTLDFEAHHVGFGRFLARLALLIGAADIEKVVDIERQLQQYIRTKQRLSLQGLHSAVSRQDPMSGDSSNASPMLAYDSSSSLRQSLNKVPSIPVQHLEVLLEPLDQRQTAVAPESSASSENEVQSIHLIFPSSFKAVVSHVQSLGQSGAPGRRLRGNSVASASGLGNQMRKPASAEITLNASVHCRAASSFMSVRHELKWLQEFIYFLPHQK